MREPEWAKPLSEEMSRIIRESPSGLMPFLEKRAAEAEAEGSYDELYFINSIRITMLLKRWELEKALELRRQQSNLESLVSPEVVQAFTDNRRSDFAELFLRKGLLQEAEQELKNLLSRIPIASGEVPQVVLTLAGLFYTKGELQEPVNLWVCYTHFVEFVVFLTTKGFTQSKPFPNVNVSYPQGIRYLFEVGNEETQKKIADGCVRLCRLLLSSSSRYLAISTNDIPFLEAVAEWLTARGCVEEAGEVKKCMDLYRQSFETAVRSMQERGYRFTWLEQNSEEQDEA